MLRIPYPSIDQKFMRRILNFAKLFPTVALIKSRSYSQRAEDVLIRSLIMDQKGSYIDIGSGLPCWGNNTYSLYKSGWTGVLVDPIQRNVRLSRVFRRRDTSICAGIGQSETSLIFYQFEPYELSTFKEDIALQIQSENFGKLVRTCEVPVVTLSTIYRSHDFAKPVILSVDTEGFEIEVLLGNDWEAFRPEIICIEEWQNPINFRTQVRDFLESQGYKLEIYNGLTAIYVHSLPK